MRWIAIAIVLFVNVLFAQDTTCYPPILIHTDYGTMRMRLYCETPIHSENFLKLAREGFYDSLLFHRVIPEFVVQGGDPNSRNAKKGEVLGQGGPGYTLPAEIKPNLYHKKGAVAAARLPDQINPERRSSGSQFYIVIGRKWTEKELQQIERKTGYKFTEEQKKVYQTKGGTPFLDGQYTVFGEITKGIEVAEKISNLPRDRYDRPLQDVRFTVEVVGDKKKKSQTKKGKKKQEKEKKDKKNKKKVKKKNKEQRE
ncbi:MAG: peptidylprolyl isomerase [Chlorobi bacterium]|nr:peptidylprolyl isomerase [Chlorobiota bacterium]